MPSVVWPRLKLPYLNTYFRTTSKLFYKYRFLSESKPYQVETIYLDSQRKIKKSCVIFNIVTRKDCSYYYYPLKMLQTQSHDIQFCRLNFLKCIIGPPCLYQYVSGSVGQQSRSQFTIFLKNVSQEFSEILHIDRGS